VCSSDLFNGKGGGNALFSRTPRPLPAEAARDNQENEDGSNECSAFDVDRSFGVGCTRDPGM